jgi:hypothetical protein
LGFLILKDLPRITDLSGLPDLPNLSNFSLQRADGLTSLDGLPSMMALENLVIFQANSLTDLQGFSVVSEEARLDFKFLDGLTSLDGLDQLTTIYNLSITRCRGLENLAGLENLENITGQFRIQANEALTSIGDLVGIQSVNSVLIEHNPVLDQCQVYSQVLDWNVQGSVVIGNNGPCE